MSMLRNKLLEKSVSEVDFMVFRTERQALWAGERVLVLKRRQIWDVCPLPDPRDGPLKPYGEDSIQAKKSETPVTCGGPRTGTVGHPAPQVLRRRRCGAWQVQGHREGAGSCATWLPDGVLVAGPLHEAEGCCPRWGAGGTRRGLGISWVENVRFFLLR